MRSSLAVAVAIFLAGPARAEAPTRYQTEAFVMRWLASFKPDPGERPAPPPVAEPFLFAAEGEPCARKKTGAAVVACLMAGSKIPLGSPTPVRQRFHADATFATWQPDPKHDVVQQHRKELAQLTDHAFEHVEVDGVEGTWELVVAVKLVDSRPVVDGLWASFIDEGAEQDMGQGREVAQAWLTAFGTSEATRKTLAAKTGFPFFAAGLVGTGKAGCAAEQTAASATKLPGVLACLTAPGDTLFGKAQATGWRTIRDPSDLPTGAPKDQNVFARNLERFDRLAVNHMLAFAKVRDGDRLAEVLMAVRWVGKTPKVDAIAVHSW